MLATAMKTDPDKRIDKSNDTQNCYLTYFSLKLSEAELES